MGRVVCFLQARGGRRGVARGPGSSRERFVVGELFVCELIKLLDAAGISFALGTVNGSATSSWRARDRAYDGLEFPLVFLGCRFLQDLLQEVAGIKIAHSRALKVLRVVELDSRVRFLQGLRQHCLL